MELTKNHERLIENVARFSQNPTAPIDRRFVDARTYDTLCRFDHPAMGQIERDLIGAGYLRVGSAWDLTEKGWATTAAQRGLATGGVA